MKEKTVEFYGELHAETDFAFLVFDGAEKIWLPKSQVRKARKANGMDYEFTVTEWIAKQKGII